MSRKRPYKKPEAKKISPSEAIARLEEALKRGDKKAEEMLKKIRGKQPPSGTEEGAG